MNLKYFCFIIVLLFSSCKKGEDNPVSSNNSLDGTWKTNGISVDMDPNEGIDMTLIFNGSNYSTTQARYNKDSSGSWKSNDNYVETGTFNTENSFLIINDSTGSPEAVLHYTIESKKLTLNSASDHGGIFAGISNELAGQFWRFHRPGGNHEYSYLYNSNGTGMFLYDYHDGSRIDTTIFNYSISSNVITHNWLYIKINGQQYPYDSNPYIGIYEIKNNKLYMYGKPKTRDNDDYYTYELFRQ